MAIAWFNGDADKRSGLGGRERATNAHGAGIGIDRAAPSNCCAGAQPNSSALLPPLGSVVLDLVVVVVAKLA